MPQESDREKLQLDRERLDVDREKLKLERDKWEHEKIRASAEAVHAAYTAFEVEADKAAVEASNHALRAVMVINGGAAAAVLAFLGALASRDKMTMASLAGFAPALTWFGNGVAFSVLALACAYVTNFSNGSLMESYLRTGEPPYLANGPKTQWWKGMARLFQVVTLTAGVVSGLCFVNGLWSVRGAIVAEVPATTSAPIAAKGTVPPTVKP